MPANEQGAGFMAAGYARASGRVGVCIVTSGPGATNTVTPVRDCMADSMPIVVICGQVPTRRDRHRRVPGGAGAIIMGAVRQARVPGDRPDQARSHGADRVRDRAHRTSRPGGHRHSEGRAELATARSTGTGTLPIPGYRHRMRRAEQAAIVDRRERGASSSCSASRSVR